MHGPMSATPKSQLGRLEPGRTGLARLTVGEEHTAGRWGSGRAPVLGTPMLVALMEAAAVDCVETLLSDGQESLGVKVEIEHIAPTPVGLEVTATAELIGIDGRTLHFKVEARDARELVGRGRHTRIVVDAARFRAKAQAKLADK
jgi:fluoroacetyl-CoA thioesterase